MSLITAKEDGSERSFAERIAFLYRTVEKTTRLSSLEKKIGIKVPCMYTVSTVSHYS
jgi:hypothetical protein